MHVLITGGYGCIGSWIAKNLLEKNAKVWMYDIKQDLRRIRLVLNDEQLQQVQFIEGNVTDLPSLQRAIAEKQITHLIHMAGLQVPICRADPILGAQVNVLGTLAVLEAVRLSQGQVKRLVYASSGAVFGPPGDYPSGPLADNVPLTPTTHYGVFKACNEGNARIAYLDHKISSIGLRPWTVYGVGRDFGMTSEPTKAIKSLVLGRKYDISYGGYQDLQYVDDVAKIFVQCLEVPYQGAQSFNVRGEVVDLPTFYKTLCEVDPDAMDLITYGEKQIPIAYDLDDSGLQRAIGPVPKTTLKDGITKTYQHFQQLQSAGKLDTYDLEN